MEDLKQWHYYRTATALTGRWRLARFMPVIILMITGYGCRDLDITCDQYYLAKETTNHSLSTEFYYNLNGTLKAMFIYQNDSIKRLDFKYANDRLEEIRGLDFFYKERFMYDQQGRLICSLFFDEDDMLTDSLAMEYDQQNRIVKKSHYTGLNNEMFLAEYSVAEYTGDNLTRMEVYEQAFPGSSDFILSATHLYKYDNRQKVYPSEFYLLGMSHTTVNATSNVVSVEVIHPDGSKDTHNYKYSYNEDGVPERYTYGSYSANFSYTCSPRI